MFRTLLVASLAAAGLLAVTTAPAQADTETFADPRGDTYVVSQMRSLRSSADILSTTGRYQDDRVGVTLSLANLTAREVAVGARFRTDDRRNFTVIYGRQDGEPFTLLLEGLDSPQPVPCEGVRGSIAAAQDRMSVSAPASCLGDPDWVRFGAATNARGSERLLADDARVDGQPPNNRITLGTTRLRND